MTRKVSHTPGPWGIKRWPDWRKVNGFSTVITDSRGHGICEFLQYGKSAKVEANTRLISKAPNLLSLLEECAGRLEAWVPQTNKGDMKLVREVQRIIRFIREGKE